MKSNDKHGRRHFLRSALRLFSLAGLGAAAGTLASRRQRAGGGQECINRSICRGCAIYDNCGLPQALSAKQVTGKR
ncbi:MAG: hypothetical protein QGD94_09410 [Planctomycetia bacterium]|nr:hypothetical protein [Planctomycetia bacterium]